MCISRTIGTLWYCTAQVLDCWVRHGTFHQFLGSLYSLRAATDASRFRPEHNSVSPESKFFSSHFHGPTCEGFGVVVLQGHVHSFQPRWMAVNRLYLKRSADRIAMDLGGVLWRRRLRLTHPSVLCLRTCAPSSFAEAWKSSCSESAISSSRLASLLVPTSTSSVLDVCARSTAENGAIASARCRVASKRFSASALSLTLSAQLSHRRPHDSWLQQNANAWSLPCWHSSACPQATLPLPLASLVCSLRLSATICWFDTRLQVVRSLGRSGQAVLLPTGPTSFKLFSLHFPSGYIFLETLVASSLISIAVLLAPAVSFHAVLESVHLGRILPQKNAACPHAAMCVLQA